MRSNFDIIQDRRNTGSLKWDCTEKIFNNKDVLPMWIADMDFLAPDKVIEAIGKRNDHGIFGYMENMPESYCKTLANWMYNRHGWSIKMEWMKYTPGVVSALSAAVTGLTEPGEGIIIQAPVYPPFCEVIKNNGRKLINNPLKLVNRRYVMDFDDLERKIKSGARMIILCSPHNPVGRVWDMDELVCLGRLCHENNVIIVSDEIHSDIVYKNHKHIPIASISDELALNSITCIAASKTFGIAGLTTATAIIPNPALLDKFEKRLKGMGIDTGNIFGIVASEAAYNYGEEWLEKLLEYLQDNLKLLLDFIERNIPEISVVKPEGTYLVWLDCSRLRLNPDKLFEFMVNNAKVGLNNGATFGIEGCGYLRINIACQRVILLEGLKRIDKAVKDLSTRRIEYEQCQ